MPVCYVSMEVGHLVPMVRVVITVMKRMGIEDLPYIDNATKAGKRASHVKQRGTSRAK